jgi:putative membrane protein
MLATMDTENSDAQIPRVMIAMDDPRVFLAAERTLLAWIRTGVAMMGLGFLVAKFGLFVAEMLLIRGGDPTDTPRLPLWIGSAMVLLGIAATLLAGIEHVRLVRRLKVDHIAGRLRLAMTAGIAFVIALTGIVMTIHLIFL